MAFLTTRDRFRLFYETHGLETGKPVLLFLNGTTQTTLQWRPQALFFKNRFSVVLYDARAQGRSDLGSTSLSLELHAKDLADLLQHLDIVAAHLVGLSHGAHLALAFAASNPEAVVQLALCSIGAEPPPKAREAVRSWIELLAKEGPEAMARAALPLILGNRYLTEHARIMPLMIDAIVRRNRPESLQAHLAAMLSYPEPMTFAASARCPVLVMAGKNDPLVEKESVERLASMCGGRAAFLDAGHTLPVEAPNRFNHVLAEFLDSD